MIEVAEGSLSYDRSTKVRLYAEAGLLEYGVVDGAAESIEVYRVPRREGYAKISRLAGTRPSVHRRSPMCR